MAISPPGMAVDDTTTFPEYVPAPRVANTVGTSDKTSGLGVVPEAGATVTKPAVLVVLPVNVAVNGTAAPELLS